jgi:hypothetical protein
MNKVKTLMGWMIVVGIAHVVEQLIFGIDELDEMKKIFGGFNALFPNPDYGIVVSVMIGVTIFLCLMYMMEARGKARVVAVSFLAFICLGESHHIIKTVLHASYFPGFVTAFPFVAVGILMISALRLESRSATSLAAGA